MGRNMGGTRGSIKRSNKLYPTTCLSHKVPLPPPSKYTLYLSITQSNRCPQYVVRWGQGINKGHYFILQLGMV